MFQLFGLLCAHASHDANVQSGENDSHLTHFFPPNIRTLAAVQMNAHTGFPRALSTEFTRVYVYAGRPGESEGARVSGCREGDDAGPA